MAWDTRDPWISIDDRPHRTHNNASCQFPRSGVGYSADASPHRWQQVLTPTNQAAAPPLIRA